MEVADPGSYIALHSSNHFELFYLCKVIEKFTAKNIEQDENGHIFKVVKTIYKMQVFTTT